MFASMREDARQTEDGLPAKEADVAGRMVELVEGDGGPDAASMDRVKPHGLEKSVWGAN